MNDVCVEYQVTGESKVLQLFDGNLSDFESAAQC